MGVTSHGWFAYLHFLWDFSFVISVHNNNVWFMRNAVPPAPISSFLCVRCANQTTFIKQSSCILSLIFFPLSILSQQQISRFHVFLYFIIFKMLVCSTFSKQKLNSMCVHLRVLCAPYLYTLCHLLSSSFCHLFKHK